MRAHAILGASSSEKWLNCTPSAQIEEALPDTDTVYSQEGDLAHLFGDIALNLMHKVLTKAEAALERDLLRGHELWFKTMESHVKDYVDFAFVPGVDLYAIEYKTDYSQFAKNGFGTVDYLAIKGTKLRIVDLKFGKGVPVYAENNSQIRLYALGALSDLSQLYEIETVEMCIAQPRLENFTSEIMAASELMAWGNDYVKPRAEKAWAGEGDMVIGNWCQFCNNFPTCPAHAEQAMAMAKHEFAEPETLDPVDLADIYQKAGKIASWLKKVEGYLYAKALEGDTLPGLKLVEGRSNRKWLDADKVKSILLEHFEEHEITNTKLKGLGDISNLMTKDEFEERLSKYIIKPPGKPVLVPESDKRKTLNSLAEAQKEFS